MNKIIQSEKFPYTVESPLFIKLISALSIPLEIWLLLSFSDFTNSWNKGDLIGALAFLITVLSIPFFLIIVFFTKTILRDDYIININCLLMKRRVLYEDIDNIKIVGNGDIKLVLTDKSSVQILCGTDKQNQVMNLIRSKIGKDNYLTQKL